MTTLRFMADGQVVLVGFHPSSGKDLYLPVTFPKRAGDYVEIPVKGNLFDVAGALGIEVPR